MKTEPSQIGPDVVAAEIRTETAVVEAFSGTPRQGTEVGRKVFLGEDCEFEGTDARVVDAQVDGGVRLVLVEVVLPGLEARVWEWEGDVVPFEDE